MNFGFINQMERKCELASAILVYRERRTNSYTNNDGAAMTMATVHDIRLDAQQRPMIQAGRPMNRDDLRAMTTELQDSQGRDIVRWLDNSVLAMGGDRMIWWTPAQSVPMFFQTKTFHGKGICPVPPMVWMWVEGDGLYIYALRDNERPGQQTSLYQAPLMNIWARGKVCIGNAVLPPKEARWEPGAWHTFMWGSNFTHPNFTEEDRLVKGIEPSLFWLRQLKRPSKVFPKARLVKLNATMADLMVPDVGNHLMKKLRKAKGEF